MNNGFPAGVGFLPDAAVSARTSTRALLRARLRSRRLGQLRSCRRKRQPQQIQQSFFNQPFSNSFFYCTNLGSGSQPFNPVPKALQRNCSGTPFSVGQWKIPATTVSNWEEGLRYHTLVGGVEATAFYFNTWNLYPNTLLAAVHR